MTSPSPPKPAPDGSNAVIVAGGEAAVEDASGGNEPSSTSAPAATRASGNGAETLADQSAPILEHLRELRRRLVYCVVAILLGTIAVFSFADRVFEWLVVPYESALGGESSIQMIFTAPHEYFVTQIKLSLFLALYLAFPVLAYQIQAFIAPGLYRREKKVFFPYIVCAPLLFILGGAFVYLIVMPLAMQFFLAMQQSGDVFSVTMMAKVSEYLSLIIRLMLAFGLIFQMPIVISLLAWAGFVSADGLRRKRRYAIVGIFLVAAFLTPPDPISQIGLAIPALLLYEISIMVAARINPSRRGRGA